MISDGVKKTFIAVQIASIDLKKGRAQTVVATSAAAAAATGAVSIPFSDAILLVPEQVAMLAGITAVFGISVEKATLTAIITGTIGTAGTTVLGKTFVSNVLKLIPGVGTAVGGAISGATAAALTAAYIILLIKVIKGEMKMVDLETEAGLKLISGIYKDQLKVKRNTSGKAQ